MTCLGDTERINRYLDGELNPAEQARFEAHLAACPACQRTLTQHRALFALLEGLPEAPVPADLGAAVLAGLPRRRTVPLGRWLLTAQAAAAVLLLALAWPSLRRGYAQLTALLPPGWLTALAVEALARLQAAWAWLRAALTVDVHLSATPILHLGLTGFQTALLTGALLILWLLGNRWLLGPHRRRGNHRPPTRWRAG